MPRGASPSGRTGPRAFPRRLTPWFPVRQGGATYDLMDNGMITNAATGDVQGRVYIEQYAPPANHDVIPLCISVAWPASATRSSGAWENAQGSVESLIFVNSP